MIALRIIPGFPSAFFHIALAVYVLPSPESGEETIRQLICDFNGANSGSLVWVEGIFLHLV